MTKRILPDLKRKRATLAPKVRFILYCEGKNTEPQYFHAFGDHCGNALIEIEANAPAGVPYTIAEKSVAKRKELTETRSKLDSFEQNDQVWAVFDRDEHPRYNDAIRHCQQNGVGVAKSNPCFELWLVLHESEYDKSDNRKTLQRHLKSLRPEYDPKKGKTPNCKNIVTRAAIAEARAEAQFNRRTAEGNPIRPPYTTVWELTREIRLAANRKLTAETE